MELGLELGPQDSTDIKGIIQNIYIYKSHIDINTKLHKFFLQYILYIINIALEKVRIAKLFG